MRGPKALNTSVYQLIYVVRVQVQSQIFKREATRFPRLDTVLMIETAVQKAKGDLTARKIWQQLPKKVMWRTYQTALDYLAYSGKIHVGKNKHVVWIWAPLAIEKLKKSGLVIE